MVEHHVGQNQNTKSEKRCDYYARLLASVLSKKRWSLQPHQKNLCLELKYIACMLGRTQHDYKDKVELTTTSKKSKAPFTRSA